MKRPFSLLSPGLLLGLGLVLLFTAQAQQQPRSLEQTLRAARWHKRVLLVAAPAADHPDYRAQKALLARSQAQLAERDFLVLDLLDPLLTAADRRFLTRKTGLAPARFGAVLLGKDGGVKLQSARPLAPAALFETVDQMPMRRQEMQRKPGRQ